MKKICIIILIVTISLTAIIVTINLKKEEKIKQENIILSWLKISVRLKAAKQNLTK